MQSPCTSLANLSGVVLFALLSRGNEGERAVPQPLHSVNNEEYIKGGVHAVQCLTFSATLLYLLQ